MCLDRTPKGRNETGPNRDLTDWVRHHDRYGERGTVDSTGRYRAQKRVLRFRRRALVSDLEQKA